MNFEKDLREQIVQLLKKDDILFNEEDSTHRLLISYFNSLNRRISVDRRKVFISDNINNIIDDKKLDEKYISALLKFKYNFENGINMNCHLSTNIYCSTISVSKNNNNYNKSRDYLLDDWGIYHLHLRDKDAKEKKEMYNDKTDEKAGNRSPYLLFIAVTNDEVYFIDIMKHSSENFSKQELLETLDRNWHFLLEKYILNDVASIFKMTNTEIKNGRRNNEFKICTINGNVYMPKGGGLTSYGTNILHTEKVDRILEDIRIIEEDIKNRDFEIKKQIQKSVENANKCLNFKLQLSTNGYLITESDTKFTIFYHIEGDNLGIYYDGFSIKY